MQPVAAPSQPEAALAHPPPTATEPWASTQPEAALALPATEPWASAQPQTTLAQAPFT